MQEDGRKSRHAAIACKKGPGIAPRSSLYLLYTFYAAGTDAHRISCTTASTGASRQEGSCKIPRKNRSTAAK